MIVFSRRAMCVLPAALVIAAPLLIAGCGGGGSQKAVALPLPSATASPVPTPAPTPTPSPSTGAVLSRRVLATYTRAQIDATVRRIGLSGVAPAQNDVQLLAVTYSTTNVRGQSTVASGLLAFPVAVSAAPLVVYHHGTVFAKNEAPSNPANAEGLAAAALFASQGYAVAAPDYLGLGESTEPQTFGYAAGLVPTSLDIVRAAHRVAQTQDTVLSSQLFLTGYSEGGYATLAVQKAMQETSTGEFTVTASAPMAGPYDLSGTTLRNFLNAPTPLTVAFVAGIVSQDNFIGGFYARESEVFAAPYNDGRVSQLFGGSFSNPQVLAALPDAPAALFTPAFLADVTQNPASPVNVFLRANDVYDFTPVAPTRFFHGGGDTTVRLPTRRLRLPECRRGARQKFPWSMSAIP